MKLGLEILFLQLHLGMFSGDVMSFDRMVRYQENNVFAYQEWWKVKGQGQNSMTLV